MTTAGWCSPSAPDSEGAVARYERDARGRVVQVTDPLGRTTTYERDAHGLTVRIADRRAGSTRSTATPAATSSMRATPPAPRGHTPTTRGGS